MSTRDVVETVAVEPKPAGPFNIALRVKGEDYGSATVPVSVPLLFGPDCLDIDTCLGGPVSLDYYDRAPFPFNGHINNVNVRYTSSHRSANRYFRICDAEPLSAATAPRTPKVSVLAAR